MEKVLGYRLFFSSVLGVLVSRFLLFVFNFYTILFEDVVRRDYKILQDKNGNVNKFRNSKDGKFDSVMIERNGNSDFVKETELKNFTKKETFFNSRFQIEQNFNRVVNENRLSMMLYFLLSTFFIFLYFNRKIRYELIPHNFGIFNKDKDLIHYDKLVKYDENCLIFRNMIKSNYEDYLKDKENIKQYLKWDSIEIERYKDKYTKLTKTDLLKFFDFDGNKLKDKRIYMGLTKGNKDFYIEFDKLTHLAIGRSSGSGKSVFLQNFLLNLFRNFNKIDELYLTDFKLVELQRYRNYEKITYINNVEDYLTHLKNLQKTMYNRLKIMSDKGIVKWDGNFIFWIVDEMGTLKTHSNKKLLDEIDTITIDLAQKRRRTNIRMMFVGQKLDTENISSNVLNNIQSKIVMRTDSNDTILKVVSDTENLLNNVGLDVKDIKNFGKGRGIYKSGDDSSFTLFQTPYFDIDKNWNLITSFLTLKKENKIIKEEKISEVLEVKEPEVKEIDIKKMEELRKKLYKDIHSSNIENKKEILLKLSQINKNIKDNVILTEDMEYLENIDKNIKG